MNNENRDANWYVVHTYSGHENKVKSKIENMIENGTSHGIYDVRVPMEEYEEDRKGKSVTKERKIFPGYVLIKMKVDSRNWYLVRNTRGVTGFIGPDGDPVPLSPQEIRKFGIESTDPIVVVSDDNIDLSIGEIVEITKGEINGFTGKVIEINNERKMAKIIVDMLGRDVLAEVPFSDIKK